MSDIQFPRGQQSIAELAAASQVAENTPPAQDAPEAADTDNSIQPVFVSPRRVVDGGGVQLLFRDTQSGEVLRSFPPDQASSVYQIQQDNNERVAADAAATSEPGPFDVAAAPAPATPAPVAAAPAEPAPEAPSAAPAESGGTEAGNLTAATQAPSAAAGGGDADDDEISLTST
ncbi:MAG: hypothetical protein AAF556_10310 [Pseudomonadota bacterium]